MLACPRSSCSIRCISAVFASPRSSAINGIRRVEALVQVEYWGWHESTGIRIADLSLMLAHKVIEFVALPDCSTSSSEPLRCINAVKGSTYISAGLRLLPLAARVQSPQAHAALSALLKLLLRIPDPTTALKETRQSELFSGAQFNASALYHAIKPRGDEAMLQGEVDGLVCTLRPFQVRCRLQGRLS